MVRRLEWVLLLVAVVAVAWPIVFGVRPRRGIVAASLLAALFAQLQIEGARWQLFPLYLLVVGLAAGDVLFVERQLRWTNRVSRTVFGFLALAVVYALPALLPVPTVPIPSGGIPVGTFSVEIVDTERDEIYGASPGGPRRVMAQVWYPATPVAGQPRVPWSEDWDIVAPAMSRRLRLPSWFLGHTRFTDGHAVSMAPVAAGTYPVVFYSHGWTGFRTVAVNQMESLASNGYIVVAIDHTYGAVATRFPDGDVIGYDPAALPGGDEVDQVGHFAAADRLIEVQSEDIANVLASLELGAVGPFAFVSRAADLGRIGVFGHSVGGGAAVRFCLLDSRCHAVLGFDPWVEPLPARVLREILTRPALFIRSDDWRGSNNDAILRGVVGRGQAPAYWLGIDGTGHNDFVLTPLLSPAPAMLGLRGSISAGRIIPILDNYLVGFFDVFLLGTGSAALDTVRFPEVSIEVLHR